MNEAIVEYLRTNRRRYTPDALRGQLLAAGYPVAEIDEAFTTEGILPEAAGAGPPATASSTDGAEAATGAGSARPTDLRIVAVVATWAALIGTWAFFTYATRMPQATYGVGTAVLGTLLAIVGFLGTFRIVDDKKVAAGVTGALVSALVLPFVLLVIVAGLCVPFSR